MLGIAYETSGKKTVAVQPGDTAELKFNFFVAIELTASGGTETWCYGITAIPSEWIKPGILAPKAFAKLTGDRRIAIYPKDSEPDSFYKESPPPQPEGYPLVPVAC